MLETSRVHTDSYNTRYACTILQLPMAYKTVVRGSLLTSHQTSSSCIELEFLFCNPTYDSKASILCARSELFMI